MSSDLVPSGGGSVLVPLGDNRGGWTCRSIKLSEDGARLSVRFEAPASGDHVDVVVLPRDTDDRVFQRLEHCAVRYSGKINRPSDERRQEVAAIVASVGGSVNARIEDLLAAGETPPISIARALGRREGRRTVVFGRDSLRALLSPEIREGVEIADGWALADIYPTSYFQEAATRGLQLVLDFRNHIDERRFRMVVGPIDPDKRAFAQSANLALTYMSTGVTTPKDIDNLCTLVAFTLQLRDHEGLSFEFPSVDADVAGHLLAYEAPDPAQDAAASGKMLNLAISAECQQQCQFCSIKEIAPALSAEEEAGDAVYARLEADLLSNRRAGVRHLRVNGYDPLRYARILEILEYARELGYDRVDVFSPCTALADPEFFEAVLARLPEDTTFHVPMYGVEPATHDRVVGRKGAFELVSRALELLLARLGPQRVRILSVVTKTSKDELINLAAFAAQRHLGFSAHFAYPSYESRQDRYFTAAPSQSETVEAILAARAQRAEGARPLPRWYAVEGLSPCVMFRPAQEAGLRLTDWLDVPERAILVGTEYREESFRHRAEESDHAAFDPPTIPCPHAERCVLRQACPAEFLRSYVELYGIEEFVPVTLRELVESLR